MDHNIYPSPRLCKQDLSLGSRWQLRWITHPMDHKHLHWALCWQRLSYAGTNHRMDYPQERNVTYLPEIGRYVTSINDQTKQLARLKILLSIIYKINYETYFLIKPLPGFTFQIQKIQSPTGQGHSQRQLCTVYLPQAADADQAPGAAGQAAGWIQ